MNQRGRLQQTIQDLGYPSAESLQLWTHELRPELIKQVRGRALPHNRTRSLTLKQHAVAALHTRPGSAQGVASTFGVTRGTLYQWSRQLRGDILWDTMPKRKPPAPTEPHRDALIQEVQDLELRIRQLMLEHYILEKASDIKKKDLGIHPSQLASAEKIQVVDALKDRYPIA